MKTVKITINKKTYQVELAETTEQQEKGLQNRKTLADDEGMLFVFDEEDTRTFWMKDTEIPLDIVFINNELEVTVVHKGEPFSETLLEGFGAFVLEVNQNSGIKPGDELDFANDKMLVLNSNAEIQMELEGGERIFSRDHTKKLIKFAKKADMSKKDTDYKALGKRLFKFLQKQEDTEPEYVNAKE